MPSGIYTRTEDHKKNIGSALLGKNNPNYGKHWSKENIEKIKTKTKEAMKNPEIRKRMQILHLGKSSPMKGKIGVYHHSEEEKQKIREANKEHWQNPEWKEKMIKKLLQSLRIRPTSLEQQFSIEFIQNCNLPYKCVGDGSFLIGYKNPDYIDTNGKKICIEVSSKREKSIKRKNRCYQSWQEYEKQRIEHFTKYGWKCIVLFAEKINGKWIFDKTNEEIRNLISGAGSR